MLKNTFMGTGMMAAASLWMSVACAQTDVDAGIHPGDDFFAYANGGWLRSTEIPPGKERWGAFNEIGERTRQQVVALVDDAMAAPPGSSARKVADFRAAYLDEAA